MNPVSFSVPVRALRALARFVSQDESRYVITGVFFELRGEVCNLVATDGRKLAAMQVELDTVEPIEKADYILDVGQILDWKLGTYYDDAGDFHNEEWPSDKVQVRIFDSCVYLNCGWRIAAGKVIEGNFPNWRNLFKPDDFKKGAVSESALDSDFLHAFGLAKRELNGIFLAHIAILYQDSPSAPMLIDIGVPRFTGLLMPVKQGDFGLPISTREQLISWIV